MTETRFVLKAGGLAVAAALALLALWSAESTASLGTSYAAVSDVAHAADVLASLALLGAGALAWHQRPGSGLAWVCLLVGMVWSAQDWIGWEGAPALRTVGALLAPLLVPLILQLTLGPRAGRPLLAGFYVAAALIALGLVLFSDPFADVSCWRNCTDDVLLVGNIPAVASRLAAAGAWLAGAGGATIAVLAALRLRGPLAWAAVAAGAAECAYGLERALGSEDPQRGLFATTFLLRASALTALALAVAAAVLSARRSRHALARLGRELADDPPGGLRALLARSLGDPGLEVGFWVPARSGYVDLNGRPVVPAGRAATSVVRSGRPVALIVHDRRLLDELRLERDIGAAASLAADNERLRAELSVHLDDLRLARARIVAAGDDRRRGLERDLHDSAQQRLLAVGYELRLAQTAARTAGDEAQAAALAGAGSEVAAVLDALRTLARGIFPAVLDEAGLGPALETLAELAPLPTEIRAVPATRLPAEVELALYLVVQTGVEAARAAGASHVVVGVARTGDTARATVRADGGAVAVPVSLQDRLGALGGHAMAEAGSIVAEVPCA